MWLVLLSKNGDQAFTAKIIEAAPNCRERGIPYLLMGKSPNTRSSLLKLVDRISSFVSPQEKKYHQLANIIQLHNQLHS